MGFADTSDTHILCDADVTALVADTDPCFDLCLGVAVGELQVHVLPGLSPMQGILV